MTTLLPRLETCQRYGRKRSAFYSDIANRLFTRPVKIGRSSRWPSNEVEAIVSARIAGKTDEDIRQLVAALEAQRSA